MTTADSQLKTVVRNWISNKIVSTNDEYLANNDFVKFHQVEEASTTSGVYSTILKDTDTSGQIEFLDALDANESETDGAMKIIGKNMFDDAVDSLETSINTINTNLMNYLKFTRIEHTHPTQYKIYQTILTNDNASGQLEFIDSLYNLERDPVAIALYDEDGEIFVPDDCPLEGVSAYNEESFVYSDELKDYIDYYCNTSPNAQGYSDVMNKHPSWWESLDAGVKSYDLVYPPDNTTPDGNMTICGKNMFDGLATRITRLEQKLAQLISAFENN